MDYSNEEWIKVYTRDTASWRATSLGARGLHLEISRNMGRFTDEVSLGARGLRAVASLVSSSWAEVEPFLEELLRDGRLVYDEDRQVLIDPEHMQRQRAASSPAQRKRVERKAKSHDVSRDVTPSHDQREEKEEKRESESARAHVTDDVPDVPVEPVEPVEPPEPIRMVTLTLDEPLPDKLLARAEGLALAAGAPEFDVRTAWTNYVGWCLERTQAPNEGRWARWVNDDIKRLKRDRVFDRERSGPRLVRDGKPDIAPAPYYRTFVPPKPDEEPADPSLAREAARKLASGVFT